MSAAALEALRTSHERLAEALESHDIGEIQAAGAELGAAVDRLRAERPAAVPARLREGAAAVAAALQNTQRRVNLLTDQLRRRADVLAAHGAELKPATYTRSAR
jgi:hypothetical protein